MVVVALVVYWLPVMLFLLVVLLAESVVADLNRVWKLEMGLRLVVVVEDLVPGFEPGLNLILYFCNGWAK